MSPRFVTPEQLTFLRKARRKLTHTALLRARDGAPHPNWPLGYELLSAFLKLAAGEHLAMSAAWARKQTSPLPLALMRKLRLETIELGGLRAERYTGTRLRGDEPTVLYLHGGGYVTCSPASHREGIGRIAHAAGARVIAPYYRLAPEHPYPAALDDAFTAYRALLAEGSSPDRLFVAGDSAGGGLSLALLLRVRDAGIPLPRAAVLLSPWTDPSLAAEQYTEPAPLDYLTPEALIEFARAYAGRHALRDPLISPLFADLRGLPPLLMQSGGWELLLEQNLRFASLAREAGVEVIHEIAPGMLHAYTCFAALAPEGRRAIRSIGAFVRAQAALPARDVDAERDVA